MWNFFRNNHNNDKITTNSQEFVEILNLRDRLIMLKQRIIQEANLSKNDTINIDISMHINGDKQKAQEIMKCFGINNTEVSIGMGYRCLCDEETNNEFGKEPRIKVFFDKQSLFR